MKAYIMLIICPGVSVCTLCKVLLCPCDVSACSVLSYQMYECHPDKQSAAAKKSSSLRPFPPFLLYLGPSGQKNSIEEKGLTVCVEGVFIPGSFEWFVFTARRIPLTSNN